MNQKNKKLINRLKVIAILLIIVSAIIIGTNNNNKIKDLNSINDTLLLKINQSKDTIKTLDITINSLVFKIDSVENLIKYNDSLFTIKYNSITKSYQTQIELLNKYDSLNSKEITNEIINNYINN